MPSYAEVIASNPSYSAKRYAARLPYVILAPAIGGLALILFFFFVPWFSTGEPATIVTASKDRLPVNVSGPNVAAGSTSVSVYVVNNDGSGGRTVSDSYSFPLIWAIPLIGLVQVVLALLLLKDRVLHRWLSLAIRFSFLVALVFELMYFASAFFLALVQVKSAGGQVATFPATGFWLSILVTIITAIVALIVTPDLNWCWTLASNDKARAVRYGELKTSNAVRMPGSPA
ncbi:MAG TPA: hypothetical protein VNE38_10975 [Ktedonobacteraceae bacterium]|nr:hypothetical protein [Ktedonobacteraceae bacterium]